MTISELVKRAHETATDKGWYDEPKTFGELIALCHSELSEALEEFRDGCSPKHSGVQCQADERERDICSGNCRFCEMHKPVGIPIELADVVIRIADMCGYYGIDLESAVKQKMEYNKTRPYKHGGKVI